MENLIEYYTTDTASEVAESKEDINKIGEAAPIEVPDDIPGLPKPGTLSHSLTLGLFNAQQQLHRVMQGFSAPDTDIPGVNKIGQAAAATYSQVPVGISPTYACLLYTSPSPRDGLLSRMPSSA